MRTSRWLQVAGTLLFAACLIYLALWIQRSWPSIRSTHIVDWSAVAASALLYAISHISASLTWPLALRSLSEPISLKDGIRIGLLAQVGKYLPGNVAHYVGRAAIASRLGIPVRQSGISTIIELASAVFACLTITAICLPFVSLAGIRLPEISGFGTLVLTATILVGIGGSTYLRRRGLSFSQIAAPTVCLTVNFALVSFSFYFLAAATGHAVALPLAIFSYVIAWGLGFVSPGAPAGLGVRETALVLLMSPEIGPGPTLALAIGHRLLTSVVDGLAGCIGYAWSAAQPS